MDSPAQRYDNFISSQAWKDLNEEFPELAELFQGQLQISESVITQQQAHSMRIIAIERSPIPIKMLGAALIVGAALGVGGWWLATPQSFDECVLDKVHTAQSERGAALIYQACRRSFR